ncbi:MAG TPA: glycosyltransferase family 2 protein [Lachnospiraceae bacterium]|nr:glycosyltransferase family 2 protein [Lachnospiraceae bacterium]
MAMLSIIVPCYNEEAVVDRFYEVMQDTLQKLPMQKEYIFVDDGSKDKTLELLQSLNKRDPSAHYVSFSRNFGKEAAIFAGLHEAKGDAVVVMDVDLQHPPETILEMVELWKEGYEVIEGVKSSRGRESIMHRVMAGSFYSLISRFMGMDMKNSSDFKFLDRKVVEVLCSLRERNTFFRALSFWVGFKTTNIPYDVQERVGGTTKWSLISLVKYAIQNMISFTFAPLYMIITAGIIFVILGLMLAIDAIVDHINGIAVAGYPTLVVLLVFATGCIMFSIGIIGVYIAKIYDEIKERPQYIVRDRA